MALLVARTDRTGVLMVGAVLGVLYLAALIAFTVAPEPLLRFRVRSSISSTDPTESRSWNIPADSQGVSRADPPGMRLPTSRK